MKTISKFLTAALIFTLLFTSCQNEDLDSDPNLIESQNLQFAKTYNNGMIKSYNREALLKWNDFLSKSVDNKMPPPAEARIYAMTTLAIHDALNNIVPKYSTYALDNSMVNAKNVSKKNIYSLADAAVSQAAHDVLINLFPPSKASADILLNECLSKIEDSEFKTQGIGVGKVAAQAILLKRQGDQLPTFTTYNEGMVPGTHQSNFMPWAVANPNPPFWPEKSTYGEFLGNTIPYGIDSGDQFRAEPPYEINSPEYTADYNEVKTQGCLGCPERTSEQTEIGVFWIENLSSSMNRIALLMAEKENLNGWETARLIALTQMAQMDANISSFEGKYYYKFWRPITAIRAGDNDGNNDTTGDLSWMNGSSTTPPTPDYPSTHAECGGAAAELFKLFFNSDNKSFTCTSPYYLPDVERNLTSFSQIANETSISRIYIGYHFRHAIEQGVIQGRKLASFILKNNLTELK